MTTRKRCLGELFFNFLRFYGLEYDPKTHGICLNYTRIDGRSPFFDLTGYLEISPLVVIDPTNFMMKNVTLHAHQITQIQRLFYESYRSLQNEKDKFEEQVFKFINPNTKLRRDFMNKYYDSEDTYKENCLVLERNTDLLKKLLNLRLEE